MHRFVTGAGLVLGIAVLAAQAQAQEQPPPETVVVTGTRIPRPAYDLANPVATVNSDEIAHSGTTNLTDYLKARPSLAGSLGDFQTSGYNTPAANDLSSLGGLNLLDLRNLGYVRTLVLIDNHRTVSESTGSAAVGYRFDPDPRSSTASTLPPAAPSAVYGARRRVGRRQLRHEAQPRRHPAKVQVGTSTDGGGAKDTETLTVGRNFDDDKGNFTLTYEGSNQDRLYFSQRGSPMSAASRLSCRTR